GSQTLVYRARRLSDRQPAVIKQLNNPYPSFSQLLQFRNQYTIAKNLELSGIIRPYSLESVGNSYALVMEDCGSISLRDYSCDRTLAIAEVLEIAVQVAQILHELHQNRVIHKDIKPANILIHPETKQVKLIDFSLASLLPKETQEIKNPNILEGTLAYLAPEQTGRMNRGIDYRSDFYALGVTLFELLTGKLPFESTDPMELVHCHIAKQPPSLGNRQQATGNRGEGKGNRQQATGNREEGKGNRQQATGNREEGKGNRQQATGNREEIPSVLADIVMKLMAKNAEDRYQSAAGLQADLQHCLAEIKTTGTIRDFEIGKFDRLSQLNIPQKLYGRETQIQQLLAAFDRASKGKGELVAISGYSGIGKTALVQELFKPLTQQQAYFISGKFDQFKRDIPYASVSEAYRGLIRQILTERDDRIAAWRDRFQAAVGENGQLVIDVIPELELLIGKQPPVPELNETAAQNRFSQTMVQFVLASRSPECPQIAFMDDVQWADLATILSLRSILNLPEHQNRLLVAAYRDNEVDASHPLMQVLAQLQADGIAVTQITLEPLSLEDTMQFLMDALNADLLNIAASAVRRLAQLLYDKTQGNPFFLTQLLTYLHSEGSIWFDFKANIWQWDIDKIQQQNIADNVVELTIGKLQKLPIPTQNKLQLAACIGNRFDLQTLATVSQQSVFQTMRSLWDAVQQGFVVALDRNYRAFLGDSEIAISEIQNSRFKFLHDRVQQAAYALIPEDRKQETHLAIGKLLWQNLTSEELESCIFEVVNHLNAGINLVENLEERLKLARLNLSAGRKAQTVVACDPALKYYQIGLDLLPADSWRSHYSLTLALQESIAQAGYLTGNFDLATSAIAAVLENTTKLLDRVKVYELRIQIYLAKNQACEAVAATCEALAEFGVSIPAQPAPSDIDRALQEVFTLLADKTPADLLDLPHMTDAIQLAILRIAAAGMPAAYLSGSPAFPLLVLASVKVSAKYGNTILSPGAYAVYGIILSSQLNDLANAYQFGKLALTLTEGLNARETQPRTCFVVGLFLTHIKTHLQAALPLLLQAYQCGREVGSADDSAYAASEYCGISFLLGREISLLIAEAKAYSQALLPTQQFASVKICQMTEQVALNLADRSQEPTILSGDAFNEAESLPLLEQGRNFNSLYWYCACKLILCTAFGQFAEAIDRAEQAKLYIAGVRGKAIVPTVQFYESLAILASISPDAKTSQTLIDRVVENQAQLQFSATYAPMNFQHKYDLVEAERSRLSGKIYETMELYDRAIEGAIANKYIQEAALANERAAEFYFGLCKPKIAQAYLKEAHLQYQTWGAIAKVRQLESRYPEWLASPERNAIFKQYSSFLPDITISKSSSSTGGEFLDLAAVIKATEAISSELVFDKLLDRLLQILLENSGAQAGSIVLERDGKLFIEFAAPASDTFEPIAITESTNVPVTVLQYVTRAQESLVIANATAEDICAADPYVLKHRPKSILCSPIVRQGKFIGLVYLENNLLVGAFASERLEVIKILMGQAAIALENTRLYQTLQQSEIKFRAFVEDANDLIYSVDTDSVFTYLSPQFKNMWGYEVADYLHKSFAPLVHPDDLPKVIASNQKLLETGEKQAGLEFRTKHRDGSWFWITCNNSPIKDARGEIVGLRGIARDISDRKRAESALAESEAYHRNLCEQSSIGLVLCNMKGELLYANTAYANIIGRTLAEVLGLTYWEITPEKYAADEQAQLQSLQTNGCYGPYEKEYIHKDGHLIPVQLSGVIVKRHGKQLIWSSVEDISDRKTAEAKLRDSELFLRSTYEGVSQGICVVDVTPSRDFRFVGWNPLIEKITGIPSADIVGKNPEELLGVSYGETVRQNYERCLSAGTTIFYEEFLPFQGRDIWWLTTLNPLKDEMGCIYRIIITTIEISDRKAAEAQIQQKNQELEQALTQLQHSQAQVVQSEKMSALGNLVAGVAHEINNPVGFLNGSINHAQDYLKDLLEYLALYQQYYPDAPAAIQDRAAHIDLEFTIADLPKLLNSMQAAIDRIKNISTSLRTFSRADTEHKVSAHLHDGLDSTLLILKYRLKANDSRPAIEVVRDYGNLPKIQCFPGQLNQVFMNIIANAIDMFDEMADTCSFKYLEAHPQQIIVQTEKVDGQALIRIRDNGKGMTAEVKTKIFDHLFTTKPVGKGTGLGLAIARQIVVEKHGGAIEVNSEIGKGTELVLILPICTGDNSN
ncbi:MAG: PAS domain S-box protein, partial [Microcoleus sp.]